MEKILITGGSGLLGSKLADRLIKGGRYEVTHTYLGRPFFPDSLRLDVSDRSGVFGLIGRLKPDVVIHTAAQTNVDRCETNRKEAWAINAEGTRNIAEACARVNAKVIYLSTDYVFDGKRGMYTEEDEPNPISYYGLTKLEGENHVRTLCPDHLIARSSVLYGWHPWKPNYVTWVIGSLREGKPISVVDDHYNSPTLADNLAEVLERIVERDVRGILHTAGAERIDRYSFALRIARIFGLDEHLITPIKMKDLKAWIARRPEDSSLNVKKAERDLGVRLLGIKEGLETMLGQAQKP
ncbi:MAG: dTDP-4-dehydrorhamnose reductase [Candidatus Bathyarchaeia archaeon]